MCKLTLYSINQQLCNGCYKCVRECPVNAISFVDKKAEIISDLCVSCGICYDDCPMEAIESSNVVAQVKKLIKESDVTIASLAPNWVSEFRGIDKSRMIEALKLVGFDHVSQTTLGAVAATNDTMEYLKNHSGTVISTTCPAVTATITKYYPNLIQNLAPVEPSHRAHAKLLKQIYGENVKVVYISSCPAVSGQESGCIDVALTFQELSHWLREEKIFFDRIPGGSKGYGFEPFETSEERKYVIPGEILTEEKREGYGIKNYSCLSYSGLPEIIGQLENLNIDVTRKNFFLDLFSCGGGCVFGRGSINRDIDKKDYFLKELHKKEEEKKPDRDIKIDTKTSYTADYPDRFKNVNTREVEYIMKKITANNIHPNCTYCGYLTCFKFAVAVAKGITDIENCVFYEQRAWEKNHMMFIENLKCGIVVIDKNNVISAYNHRFVEIMRLQNLSKESIQALELQSVIPFYPNVMDLITNDYNGHKEVSINNKIYDLSAQVFSNGSICVFIRNVITRDTGKDEVEERARNVINANIETIQQIAYLLGENASRVEGILQDFIDYDDK